MAPRPPFGLLFKADMEFFHVNHGIASRIPAFSEALRGQGTHLWLTLFHRDTCLGQA